MLPAEDLFVYVYVLIHDLMAAGYIKVPPRPGPAPACSDAELLAIAEVRHLLGRRSEAGFLAEVAQDWGHLFPHLPHQSEANTPDPLAVGRVRAARDHARGTAAGRRLPAGGHLRAAGQAPVPGPRPGRLDRARQRPGRPVRPRRRPCRVVLRLPARRENGPGQPDRPRLGHRGDQRSWRELATAEPIRIPGCARPLFAAHLAYRRVSGAAASDPYFEHPRDPGNKPPAECLRAAIRSTTRRIGLDLPWMHADDCRYGADIGLTWRGQSWLAERGLRLARTGPGQDPAITPPWARPCPLPHWVSGGPP